MPKIQSDCPITCVHGPHVPTLPSLYLRTAMFSGETKSFARYNVGSARNYRPVNGELRWICFHNKLAVPYLAGPKAKPANQGEWFMRCPDYIHNTQCAFFFWAETYPVIEKWFRERPKEVQRWYDLNSKDMVAEAERHLCQAVRSKPGESEPGESEPAHAEPAHSGSVVSSQDLYSITPSWDKAFSELAKLQEANEIGKSTLSSDRLSKTTIEVEPSDVSKDSVTAKRYPLQPISANSALAVKCRQKRRAGKDLKVEPKRASTKLPGSARIRSKIAVNNSTGAQHNTRAQNKTRLRDRTRKPNKRLITDYLAPVRSSQSDAGSKQQQTCED
ncbi:hypothetical protein BT63DRAFT_435686 [Microthyrium microscopicum]|uniref:Uncharacterized protein n=1 Tax=Microthyrium microscopicum TaxID=703497 RepID=A0A6A6USZ9_9PEZI|nr:hypothetical protein BT63DRAFT_435686 [Microthyrium microscopicum]